MVSDHLEHTTKTNYGSTIRTTQRRRLDWPRLTGLWTHRCQLRRRICGMADFSCGVIGVRVGLHGDLPGEGLFQVAGAARFLLVSRTLDCHAIT